MKKIFILTICYLLIGFAGFAQLYSDFPVTNEKSAIDSKLIGVWEIMPKEESANDEDKSELKSTGFIILTSAEDNGFKMQILNRQSDGTSIYYNSTEYKGYVSVLDNHYFLNLQEVVIEEPNEEDELVDEFETEQGYLIFKIEMTNGGFILKTPVVPSNKTFSSQSSFTEFVQKNIPNSFFYYKEADYAYNIMMPLKLK